MKQPWDGFLMPKERASSLLETESFADRRILITGAGGYIGSAIARAISPAGPARLLLLDTAEHGLYSLQQHLTGSRYAPRCDFVVGSVCDDVLVRELFDLHRPEIVFHAAALKHVPLMESNPFAAAETNALGTLTIANAAARAGAKRFVLLSTDKAVDPVSIMGATKRIAERIVLADRSPTRMLAVRLGNVLGSSGSVAPLFAQQIARGGPVTVTHPEASRYFLSLAEAIRWLLLAASSEQRPGILVPAVDPPRRIDDLARFLIRVLAPAGPPIDIAYTGLRPGDKLHEHMTSPREIVFGDAGQMQAIEGPDVPGLQLFNALDRVRAAVRQRDLQQLLGAIAQIVPEYQAEHSLQAQSEALEPRI